MPKDPNRSSVRIFGCPKRVARSTPSATTRSRVNVAVGHGAGLAYGHLAIVAAWAVAGLVVVRRLPLHRA